MSDGDGKGADYEWSNLMLDTCNGFLLLLRNLAFGEVSELNGSV